MYVFKKYEDYFRRIVLTHFLYLKTLNNEAIKQRRRIAVHYVYTVSKLRDYSFELMQNARSRTRKLFLR
jgi:hypothetical protein